jgi:hypothetical protein
MKSRICLFVLVVLSASLCLGAAPTTRQGGQVNLLSMGDWGNNGPGQRRVAATLKQHITSVAPRTFNAMLLAGDNFYVHLDGINDPKWKTMFEDLYEPAVFDFPFYPSLGNHDYQENRYLIEQGYSKAHPESRWRMPDRWFRVDVPENDPLVTILMLDSNAPLLGDADWERERLWIKTELGKPRVAKWVICVAHHPLVSNGDHGDNGALARDWAPLFNDAKVDFYICGHDHDLQHLITPGVKPSQLMVGGGGATTRPMRNDKRGPFSKALNGFADLEFTDRRARVRLISGGDGSTLHEFTRAPDGAVTVIQSVPSDVAIPRTVKSITRGGEETTKPTKEKSKEKDD